MMIRREEMFVFTCVGDVVFVVCLEKRKKRMDFYDENAS